MSCTKDESEQAVIVTMPMPGEIDDLFELEQDLSDLIDTGGLGEFDGNEIGMGEAMLFMYGPNAEKLFEGIGDILRKSPLCRGAKVVIRYGSPGARERVVIL